MTVTPLGAYYPPVVVTDWQWWVVDHPEIDGVRTFYKIRAEAEEHSDRLQYRYGRRPLVHGVATLP